MSSVSGIGNSSLNPLDPYSLQQANGQGTTQTSATDLNATTTDSTDGTEASSGHHHHHGGGGGGISSQIESAVTSALQDAPDGADPNQTIQDAIAGVLKQGSGPSLTDPSQTATDGTDGTGSTSEGDFNTLLQQHGINPKQFQEDFQTAVKNIQNNGTVDFGSLFKSFPPGAAVDTTA
jgi:hypothetical protein